MKDEKIDLDLSESLYDKLCFLVENNVIENLEFDLFNYSNYMLLYDLRVYLQNFDYF